MPIMLDYAPKVFVVTEGLSEPEWLAWRRKGIGGSDTAALLGISPWVTSRDLYYDKVGIVAVEDNSDNWVQFEVGHRLEDLVAMIFKVKTGLKVYPRKVMFQHPLHPFMLADLDFLIETPDGSLAILECKTTAWHNRTRWWNGEQEVIPAYYETQGAHYMSVMNINRTYFCCLYGNSIDDVIIRQMDRDLEREEELMFLEEDFWNNNVLARVPPAYSENGNAILESVQRHYGLPDSNAPAAVLDGKNGALLAEYLELQGQKQALDAQSRKLKEAMDQIKGPILDQMGVSGSATCAYGGSLYNISATASTRMALDKDSLLRLKAQYPEIYDKFVTPKESRKFNITRIEQEEAA